MASSCQPELEWGDSDGFHSFWCCFPTGLPHPAWSCLMNGHQPFLLLHYLIFIKIIIKILASNFVRLERQHLQKACEKNKGSSIESLWQVETNSCSCCTQLLSSLHSAACSPPYELSHSGLRRIRARTCAHTGTQSSGSVTHCSTISLRLGFSMAAATRSLSFICLFTGEINE